MQNNFLAYDSTALKSRLVTRHGVDLGTFVFDAEVRRRQLQDARAAELSAELTALHLEVSTLSQAAGERRAKSELRLKGVYAAYMTMCDAEAQADAAEQAQISTLTNHGIELQQQMRNISLPRLSERELQDLAVYTSTNSDRLRSVDKQMPPIETPSLTALGRINMSVGLQKPRF
jgi:hypothetical protein